ncbi:MAG TPA: transposase, partial [Pseudonocardia sp.]
MTGIGDAPRRGPISELPAHGLATERVLLDPDGSTRRMLIGWDWASETHDVTVLDETGARVARWAPTHTEDGLARTLARLRGYGDPAGSPVAIESTRGLVVDRLLAAGHPVVPIHPNAFHAVRPRWGAAKAKTDAGDSFKLADYLRTDGHTLRRIEPTDQATLDVQALTRT